MEVPIYVVFEMKATPFGKENTRTEVVSMYQHLDSIEGYASSLNARHELLLLC